MEAAGFTNGRPDGPPLWLVVHTMEAQESSTTAENTAAYFANPGDGRNVSAHYCCDNNSIVQCVRLKDSAWTVGNRPGNNRGINFEFAGFASQSGAQWGDAYSTMMLERVAPIMRSDAAKYAIPLRRCSVNDLKNFRPGVTSHNDLRLAFGVTTHTDPGPNFPWTWFINLLNGEDGFVDYAEFKAHMDKWWDERAGGSGGTNPEQRRVRARVRLAVNGSPEDDPATPEDEHISVDKRLTDQDAKLDEMLATLLAAIEAGGGGGPATEHTHDVGPTGPVIPATPV